ncbi:phospholipase A2 inhibitor and Ly6/PLAUR domain-containing protein-like [Pseudophryne corroboree]|uniref:phospholipase A2 inhibitor and Ly6/PLAUR domain-containing protein-like n=1 Tax=Pseudophryne corroboree TaxID=495146 RepID=UPI003081F6CD
MLRLEHKKDFDKSTGIYPYKSNCIKCVECSKNKGLDCVGGLVTCGTCMTTLTKEDYGGGNIWYSVKKTCNLSPAVCNYTYSLSSENFTTTYTSSCCGTDLCNNKTVQVTPRNPTENGIKCPSCQLASAEGCVANSTVRCTGSETKCLIFKGKYTLQGTCQESAFQGCATENVCEHAGFIQEHPGSLICGNSTVQCTDSHSTSPKP